MREITFEEAIKALKEGKKVYIGDANFYYIEDGFLVYMNKELGTKIFNAGFRSDYIQFNLDEPEVFKITETGLYKTRDGSKAFISCAIGGDFDYAGVVEGTNVIYYWNNKGISDDGNSSDIISKWEGSE